MDLTNLTPSGASPVLKCQILPAFRPNNWDEVDKAFSDTERCFLAQHWLPEPEPSFQSAQASAGWQEQGLWVYAELFDQDIFNAANGLNQDTCELGDVFEIFLRPAGAETYFEFHVTPENHLLQLRWPDADAIVALRAAPGSESPLRPYHLHPRRIRTWTHIDRGQNKWRVLAFIDWTVLERQPQADGETWAFSFSRYDATRQSGTTMLSSTSPHPVVNFHRQEEWGTLHFEFPK